MSAQPPKPNDDPSPPARTSATRAGVYPTPVERLIEEFCALPGIGRRSAERLAFHVLKSTAPDALRLARAIESVKTSVRHCDLCWNLSDAAICGVCANPSRDRSTMLVVEQPKDLLALEQTAMYKGVYHVLMGRLSPLDGINASDLTIAALIERLRNPSKNPGSVVPREVILGLNPTLEGDGTALFLQRELASTGVRITRLARGLPSGSQLEYANRAVLADAIVGRQSLDGL